MAKKIPKIPVPRARTKMSLSDKIWAGIAGLSPFANRAALHQSMTSQTAAGRAAQAAQMKRLAQYGKWGSRAARFSGLMNPWTSIPIAGTYLAKHLVGNALEGYKNPDVGQGGSGPLWLFDNRGISTEGHARLAMEARAREQGIRREDMDLEPFLRAQQELELNRPTYAQLRESFLARQNQNAGGLAGLL